MYSFSVGTAVHKVRIYFLPLLPYEHIQLSIETVKHISCIIWAKNNYPKNSHFSDLHLDQSLVNTIEHRAVHMLLLYQHSCRILFSSFVIKENLSNKQ